MSAGLNKPVPLKIVAGQAGFFMLKGRAAFSGTNKTFALDVPFKHVHEVLAFPVTNGTNSSATAGTPLSLNLGTISATASFLYVVPSSGTLNLAKFVDAATIASSGTNFWAVGIVNKTQTLTIVDSTAAGNTNNNAAGSGTITAYTAFSLLVTAANAAVAVGDVLEITFTKNSAAGNLTETALQLGISATGAIDKIACADAAGADATTGIIATSGGVLNFVRETANISGLLFDYIIFGTES